MINEDKLNMLYNSVLESDTITTKKLNEMGFNSKDIIKLMSDSKLKEVNRGIYKVIDIKGLHKMAKQIFFGKNTLNARKLYEYIYEMDKTDKIVITQLFNYAILEERYDDAFIYLDNLFLIGNDDKKEINNLYLFLLSFIIKLPEKYQTYISNLKLEDLIFNHDSNYKKFIEDIYKKDFITAKKELYFNFNFRFSGTYNINVLLNKIITNSKKEYESKNKEKTIFLELIIAKDYEKLVELLDLKNKNNQLNLYEKYLLKLTNNYLSLKKNRNISNLGTSKSNNIFSCIKANDYFRALELCKNYNEEKKISNDKSCLYLILNDICKLINSIKEELEPISDINKMVAEVSREYQNNEYFGIDNFLVIHKYIINSKLDIVSACLELNLDKEKILIILLIYAREFFLQGWYNEGEQILQSVERSKNKSSKILKVISEIRRNILLYQYRDLEDHQFLELNLVIKKIGN